MLIRNLSKKAKRDKNKLLLLTNDYLIIQELIDNRWVGR